MMRVARTILQVLAFILLIVLLTACASRAVQRPVNRTRVFAAAFDEVWRATVRTVAESQLSIATLEKESGLIVLLPFSVTEDQCDIGTLGFFETLMERSGRGNFTVVETPGATEVSLNLKLSARVRSGNGSAAFPYSYYWIPAASTGRGEAYFLEKIERELGAPVLNGAP